MNPLTETRKTLGFTKKRMAEEMGISESTWDNWVYRKKWDHPIPLWALRLCAYMLKWYGMGRKKPPELPS